MPYHSLSQDSAAVRDAPVTLEDPNALLGRKQAAAALRAAGYQVAASSLATLACRGGGPLYSRFGARALYRWADLLEWARARMTEPRRSAAEHGDIGGAGDVP